MKRTIFVTTLYDFIARGKKTITIHSTLRYRREASTQTRLTIVQSLRQKLGSRIMSFHRWHREVRVLP